MKKMIGFLFLVLIIKTPSANAQFPWQVTHTDSDWRYQYNLTSLSCAGNVCTATGLLIDHLSSQIKMMFWRSTNSGLTWVMQDPGLPYELGENQNVLRTV